MVANLPHLQRGDASLSIVPAIHFRVAFAEEVNRLCGDPDRRPDAIAVELGPLTAAAVRAWMVELGIGPSRRVRLPCMLGLVKPNRYLHPAVRERALQLQRETGKELHELSPEVLQQELGYAPASVLLLSPTDSIIEAVRCACELAVPLYGVDLEESADSPQSNTLVQDPTLACGRVADYVRDNTRFAESCYDDVIDQRRETVMAARLQALLARHHRILFTCGLAHGQRIVELLNHPSLRPASTGIGAIEPADWQAIRRIVVHPRLAAGRLDTFPAVAARFERQRPHPVLGTPVTRRAGIDHAALFDRILRRTYQRYFGAQARQPATRRCLDWSARTAFEQLLRGYMLLDLRVTPDLGQLFACASTVMSPEFCKTLLDNVMDFPWAKPDDFPDQATLQPAGEHSGAPMTLTLVDPQHGSQDIVVTICQGGQPDPLARDVPWHWVKLGSPITSTMGSSYTFTWKPWEHLATALSHRAIARAGSLRWAPCSKRFSGQLLDGIDVKATLRAHARGTEQVWVRHTRLQRVSATDRSTAGYPVVWIFDDGPCEGNEWQVYYLPLRWIEPHVRNRSHFKRRYQEKGGKAAEIIGYGREQHALNLEPPIDRLHRVDLQGLVIYGPIFGTLRQSARWFELTDLSRNPLFDTRSAFDLPDSLVTYCAEHLGLPLGQLRWQDDLVRLAIPFADRAVTVVAPATFRLAPIVLEEATRQGKILNRVPLDSLPAPWVARLRQNYMVPARLDGDDGHTVYESGAEQAIGEALDGYQDLVPPEWLTFGLDA